MIKLSSVKMEVWSAENCDSVIFEAEYCKGKLNYVLQKPISRD